MHVYKKVYYFQTLHLKEAFEGMFSLQGDWPQVIVQRIFMCGTYKREAVGMLIRGHTVVILLQ